MTPVFQRLEAKDFTKTTRAEIPPGKQPQLIERAREITTAGKVERVQSRDHSQSVGFTFMCLKLDTTFVHPTVLSLEALVETCLWPERPASVSSVSMILSRGIGILILHHQLVDRSRRV